MFWHVELLLYCFKTQTIVVKKKKISETQTFVLLLFFVVIQDVNECKKGHHMSMFPNQLSGCLWFFYLDNWQDSLFRQLTR